MSHRRADVWLPAEEARCVPSRRCDRVWTCGRYLAAIPAHGGVIADFALLPVPCPHWRAVERPPASAPAARRVHPPISSHTPNTA